MTLSDYLSDKRAVLLTCLAGGLFFSVLLYLYGIAPQEIFLLWICYAGIVSGSLCRGYVILKKRLLYLQSLLDSLDRKYLMAEVAQKPVSSAEKVYFRMIKEALKSMTDEVSQAKRLNEEYRDFIEQWIHEIKIPITGIQLLCENNKSDTIRKIMSQTEQIGRYVERGLFYQRTVPERLRHGSACGEQAVPDTERSQREHGEGQGYGIFRRKMGGVHNEPDYHQQREIQRRKTSCDCCGIHGYGRICCPGGHG